MATRKPTRVPSKRVHQSLSASLERADQRHHKTIEALIEAADSAPSPMRGDIQDVLGAARVLREALGKLVLKLD